MAILKKSGRTPLVPKRPARIHLDDYLKLRKMERKDLAAKLDTTEATVSRWANEERKPNIVKQRAIEEALRISPGDLYRPPGSATREVLLAGLSERDQADALSYIAFLRSRAR